MTCHTPTACTNLKISNAPALTDKPPHILIGLLEMSSIPFKNRTTKSSQHPFLAEEGTSGLKTGQILHSATEPFQARQSSCEARDGGQNCSQLCIV
jgi:hypothetical protein